MNFNMKGLLTCEDDGRRYVVEVFEVSDGTELITEPMFKLAPVATAN
jgi:hypothetical protein